MPRNHNVSILSLPVLFLGFLILFIQLSTESSTLPIDYAKEFTVHIFEDVDKIDVSTFPPLVTVVETILFFTSGPLVVDFQETFCNGKYFLIYDNGVFIANVSTPGDHFCGINTSSYTPIVSPIFASYQYDVTAGQHNLTAVVVDSPLADGTTTLRITFNPNDPSTVYTIYAAIKRILTTAFFP